MVNTKISMSEKLIALRERHDLSQAQVAEAAGINFRTYQNIEYGRTEKMSLGDGIRLARSYGMTVEDFVSLTEYDFTVGAVKNQSPAETGLRKDLIRTVIAIDAALIPRALTLIKGLGKAPLNKDEDGSATGSDSK